MTRLAVLVGLGGAALFGSTLACSASSTTGSAGPDGGRGDDAMLTPDRRAPHEASTRDAPADVSTEHDAALEGSVTADTGTGAEAGTKQTMETTFYGWDDNSPPGGAIAYPKSSGFPTLHDTAGGTGTFADPITFATDKKELAVGTIVYAPFIEKYLIMEDDCGQCDTDWSTAMSWHIDIWMNSNGEETASKLFACEDQWTRSATSIEIDPPAARPVTTNPLFDPATDACRSTP